MSIKILKLQVLAVIGILFSINSFAATPVSVDLRPFFGPAKNQYFRGSCATFASLAALEYYTGVPSLSEAYTYAKLKENDLMIDGSNLNRMKEFLDANSLVEANLMPYEPIGAFGFNEQSATEVQIARAYNKMKAAQAAILDDQAIYHAEGITVFNANQVSFQWLRETLTSGLPIVATFQTVHDEWVSAPKGFIGINANYQNAIPNGGHAVLLVGYTTNGYFIFRNSWGVEWGDQGYGYMTEASLSKHLMQVMTVARVRPQWSKISTVHSQAPEKLEIKARAFYTSTGSLTANFSLLLMDPHLTGSFLDSAHYSFYGAQDVQPFAQGDGNAFELGMPITIVNMPTRTVRVNVVLHHTDGSTTTIWRPVTDVVSWSETPIIK